MSGTSQTKYTFGSIVPWRRLDGWSATAFLVAGALLFGFAALVGVEVFMGVAAPQALLAVPGLLAAFVGLLGLYPRLADAGSRLATAGVVAIGLAAVGFLVSLVVVLTGVVAGNPGATPPEAVVPVAVALAILGYVLLAVASLRAAVPSRRVGMLLLGPPAVFAVMMAGALAGYTPGWSTFAIACLQAAATLAIGLALRAQRAGPDRTEASSGSAA